MRIGFYKIFSIAALILSTACTSAKKIDSSTSGSENNLNLATSPDKKTDLDKVETKTETDSQTSNVQIDEYHRSLPNQYNHCENWKFSEELFKEKDAAKFIEVNPNFKDSPDFRYDVGYYVPSEIPNTKRPVFISLHGGGLSTLTRQGSLEMAQSHMAYSKFQADKFQAFLITPSGSALNWGAHTTGYLKCLIEKIRKLPGVDPDQITLEGVSMGGMGITRSFNYLSDKVSNYLPMSAGIDPRQITKNDLIKLKDTTYYHIQGIHDHFEVFPERCREQEAFVKKLEDEEGEKIDFHIEYHDGGHFTPDDLIDKRLNSVLNLKRNLYRKKLHGVFQTYSSPMLEQDIKYSIMPNYEYFWTEVVEFKDAKSQIRDDFVLQTKDNIVHLDFVRPEHNVKVIRLYLSTKIFDFSKPITINVDKKEVFSGRLQQDPEIMQKIQKAKSDPSFIFEQYIDLELQKDPVSA